MGNPSKRADQAAALPSPRLPPPPRTPSFLPGARRGISGTVAKPTGATPTSATALKAVRQPSPPPARSPAMPAERFGAEEPVSFDKRLTPVVPAIWLEPGAGQRQATPPTPDPAPTADTAPPVVPVALDRTDVVETAMVGLPQSTTSLSRAPSAGSESTPSLSLAPSTGSEHAFWDAPPAYSMPPANLFSERPHRKASGARSLLTKFLFVAVISAIAMLLCYEISVAFRLPQLDPRVLFRHLRSG